ncbi:unnamed protein product [Ceutorhynchus assimilis]|uniref:Spaetzle domain-containing protein n=1 Tax=Ceutorhynchus assimilis TaxID=467358 RepID=A0A9N9MWN6_9CUCU|nr:unnamed protein product [Ceutorhynchus assimilis]
MVQFSQLVIVFIFASFHPNSKSIALKLKLNLDLEEDDSKEIEIKSEDLSKSHPHRHKHEKPNNLQHEETKVQHFLDPASETPGKPKIVITRSNFPDEATEDEDYDPEYPYFEIKLYMQERPHLQKYLSPPIPQIGNRLGITQDDLEEGETLCRSRINLNYRPRKLKNNNNMHRIIVNDEEYQQFMRTEICSNEPSRCQSLDFPRTTTSCVQRYSTRRLVVFTNGTHDELDDFTIPSCCVCKVKQIDDIVNEIEDNSVDNSYFNFNKVYSSWDKALSNYL